MTEAKNDPDQAQESVFNPTVLASVAESPEMDLNNLHDKDQKMGASRDMPEDHDL